ncbi:sulfite reductase subunit beta [Aeromicrobium sp. PE09-221]|uniref:sulfite reductase subunit beta n=1 Tax=Aeromicrobium sp. PE09-221 TaxID=1898043 RepID=UPI000B3E4385|nr:sulfite reductase subunit beta [Aeromicrobium sp. PE09-221]OUZ07564.1 sulfite reductase subunit beta [Aeromicrobium sp. PE09-221]
MTSRTRSDRCPGVFRPWIADDGALVRLRLAGAPLHRLHDLVAIAERWGDGALHLTSRANLQIRGVSHEDGCVPAAFVEAVTEAGLLPFPAHELIRNIEISPMSGRAGGRADVRPVAAELDRLLCSEHALAALPGRFLFVLDDGRGDVAWRPLDLGLLALDDDSVQLRIGDEGWGPVVTIGEAASALAELARDFIDARGTGPDAPWHVDELDRALCPGATRDPRTRVSAEPWPPGIIEQHDGRVARHVPIPEGRLDRTAAQSLPDEVIVTPWRSVIVPDQEPQ